MDLYKAAFILGAVICTGSTDSELTCALGEGKEYRGKIAVTWSGRTCQMWSAQWPHKHSITPANYPKGGLESNYCRNPNNGVRPWCYTTDPKTQWEFCIVPKCEDSPGAELTCTSGNGKEYRGTIAETWSGKTCQRWSDQKPHEHSYTPQKFPSGDLESNYCRNPNDSEHPWCYTTDPNTRWEYCSVPKCGTTPEPARPVSTSQLSCLISDGTSYRGTVAQTWSGKTCQSWSAQAPHKHNFSPSNHPGKGLDSNFCRNPNGLFMPWCFTTDPETVTDYCRVPLCVNTTGPGECIHCRGENYRGKISTTDNGFTCQRWDSQTPHKHDYTPSAHPEKHLEENYCRNPSGDSRLWCYTTDPSKRWDFCSVPHCTSVPSPIVPELTCATGDGSAYRGTIAVTESGKTCQSWSDQKPHRHNHTPCKYPCGGLENNYCRNPNNEKRPWCYTTDPDTLWEFCDVLSCGK